MSTLRTGCWSRWATGVIHQGSSYVWLQLVWPANSSCLKPGIQQSRPAWRDELIRKRSDWNHPKSLLCLLPNPLQGTHTRHAHLATSRSHFTVLAENLGWSQFKLDSCMKQKLSWLLSPSTTHPFFSVQGVSVGIFLLQDFCLSSL